MLCARDNGEQIPVVVKCKENRQSPTGPKVLVNELVAGLIARHLGVPVPRPLLVSISTPLRPTIGHYPGMRVKGISSGLHFGVPYLENRLPGIPNSLITTIANLYEIPLLILFEVLCCNTDIINPANFVLHRPSPGHELRLAAIDHGNCFGGPDWDEFRLKWAETSMIRIWPPIANLVFGSHPFQDDLQRLSVITPEFLRMVTESVPAEWGCSNLHFDALRRFLIERPKHVGDIIKANRHLFGNWR